MKTDINLKNIKSFFQGNARMIADSLAKRGAEFLKLDSHIKEQVFYRKSLCSDCEEIGECKICGCSVPGKWFSDRSCGGPWKDMLNADEWEKFKVKNNIHVKIEE